MKLIVGLGNTGGEYEQTRHNIGFEVVEKIAFGQQEKVGFKEDKKLETQIAKVVLDGEKAFLAKPLTYMNLSGRAVAKIINYYNLKVSDLVVIHDDLDLKLGQIQIKSGGGAGGHHGLESIVESLGTKDFIRIRLGIGKMKEKKVMTKNQGVKYVLQRFNAVEKKVIEESIMVAVEAVKCLLKNDVLFCMNRYNKKISDNMPMELDAS